MKGRDGFAWLWIKEKRNVYCETCFSYTKICWKYKMGYHRNTRECSECGGIMICEFRYNSSEYSKLCSRCGRKEYQFIDCEKTKSLFSNEMFWTEGFVPGNGVIAERTDGIYLLTSIEEITIEEMYEQLDGMMKKEKVDKEKSYMTYRNKKTGVLEMMFGAMPPDYVEEFEE